MAELYQIVQTTQNDISRVSEFLEKAEFVHRHLDWHPLMDWIRSEPFLIQEDKSQNIHALLALPPDPPGIAWIHCFAVDKANAMRHAWQNLYQVANQALQPISSEIFAVGLEEWFTHLLLEEGFSIKQNIVVLAWNHHLNPAIHLDAAILLRPLDQSDLEEVARVDAASFEPVWVNSKESLYLAYLQSEHASVAEINGKIVAYELSTASQYSAHLARLAVLPEFRHRQIGTALVREMLAHYARRGMIQVTVNTQNDNVASLRVYKSLGFEPTFEEYPVLSR